MSYTFVPSTIHHTQRSICEEFKGRFKDYEDLCGKVINLILSLSYEFQSLDEILELFYCGVQGHGILLQAYCMCAHSNESSTDNTLKLMPDMSIISTQQYSSTSRLMLMTAIYFRTLSFVV